MHNLDEFQQDNSFVLPPYYCTTPQDHEMVCHYLAAHPEINIVNLSRNNFTANSIRQLAQLSSIHSLDLHGNYIGNRGAKLLANKSYDYLNLSKNNITSKGALNFKKTSTIGQLDLSYNAISEKVLKIIKTNPYFNELIFKNDQTYQHKWYHLFRQKETKPTRIINKFYRQKGFKMKKEKFDFNHYYNLQTQTLNLAYKKLSDANIIQLCEFLNKNPNITKLDLSHTFIKRNSIKKLAENTTLIELSLESNWLGNREANIIAQHPTLISLNLSGNRLSDLSKLGASKTIKELNVSENLLDASHLAGLQNNDVLETLNLSRNHYIFTAGVKKLKEMNLTKLKNLDMSWNFIDNEGAIILSSMTLKSLNLSFNDGINDEGLKAFLNNKSLIDFVIDQRDYKKYNTDMYREVLAHVQENKASLQALNSSPRFFHANKNTLKEVASEQIRFTKN